MDLLDRYQEIKKGREKIIEGWKKDNGFKRITKQDKEIATNLAILNLKDVNKINQ